MCALPVLGRWQVVFAIIGLYTSAYLLFSLASGGKKPVAVAAEVRIIAHRVSVPRTSTVLACRLPPPPPYAQAKAPADFSGYKSGVAPGASAIPSVADAGFEAWAKVPGNMKLWEAAVSKM